MIFDDWIASVKETDFNDDIEAMEAAWDAAMKVTASRCKDIARARAYAKNPRESVIDRIALEFGV